MPYFLSTLDSAAWRTGVPESLYPEALVPGQREIGSQAAANMWGNVYPRSGFVSQTDDDKASAVVAQRVADIITRAGRRMCIRCSKATVMTGTGHRARLRKTPAHAITNGSGWPHDTVMCRLRTGATPPRATTTKPLRSGSPTAAANDAGRHFWAALISDEENREKTPSFSAARVSLLLTGSC